MDKPNADSDRDRLERFGTLPARIQPDTTVETVETGSPRERPVAAGTEEQRQVFLAGG